jgi:hypothetical protein
MWVVLLKRWNKPSILYGIEIQSAAITRTNRINFADIKNGVSCFVSMYCLQCLSLTLLNKYRFSNIQVVFRTRVCNNNQDVYNKCKRKDILRIGTADSSFSVIWTGLVHDYVHVFLRVFVHSLLSFTSPHFVSFRGPWTSLLHRFPVPLSFPRY